MGKINNSWSITGAWNSSLLKRKERPLESRERIWASEIGGAHIDRYLKMKGVKPTNLPNNRSLRKFQAGNFFEGLVSYILARCGLLISTQEYLTHQYPGLLEVTGKLDFVAGGTPNYDKHEELINGELSWLPEFMKNASLDIIQSLRKQHPDGLKEIIIEVKSCSAYMFELYESRGDASKHHKYQLYHYLKCKKMEEGRILYICKDDLRLIEIPVKCPNDELEKEYREDIEKMTHYIKADVMPPKELFIVYEKELQRFSANFRCGYSQYLSFLYGLENQKEFDDKYKPIAERWNRVISRLRDGKDMTKNNAEALKEMEAEGFDVDKIKEDIKNGNDAE